METYETAKEALEAALQIWQCLEDHPKFNEKGKAYKYLKIDMNRDLHMCPACQFTANIGSNYANCEKCPIWDCESDYYLCESHDSPYAKWNLAGDNRSIAGRKEADHEMVELIKQRISELK